MLMLYLGDSVNFVSLGALKDQEEVDVAVKNGHATTESYLIC